MDVQTLNAMAWGYVGMRVLYNVVYINLGEIRKTSVLRSAVWGVSMIISVSLFVVAGVNAKDGHFV